MTTPPCFFQRHGKAAIALAAVTLLSSNCADMNDRQLTQAQGAGIGAGAGALIGGIIGHQSGNALEGAAIGGAIGGLGGLAYGTHVANQKAKYASAEAWLDACIADASKKRSAAVAYNKRLNGELARLEREVRSAQASNDKARLKQLNGEIRREKAAADQEVKNFSKEAQLQRSAIQQAGSGGGSRVSTLRSTTDGIETQVSTMKKSSQRMASLASQTDV